MYGIGQKEHFENSKKRVSLQMEILVLLCIKLWVCRPT